MARLQDLHPDQQAVLQLVLRRGMAYASIADVLGLTAEQVRERALDAVDGLVPDDIDGLALEDRDRIADHLLEQESPDERQATAGWIAGDEPARTWAGLVMAEIAPLRAVQAVPGQVPAAGAASPVVVAPAVVSSAGPASGEAADPAPESAPSSDADPAPDGDDPTDGNDIRQAFAALGHDGPNRPKVDGPGMAAVGLIATVGLAVVVVIVLWVSGVFDGGDDDGDKASTPPATTTTATTTPAPAADTATAAAIVAALPRQINFDPPANATAPYAKAAGVGEPDAVEGVPGIVFQGKGFPPMTKSRLYAVWIDGGGKKPVRLGWFSDGSNKTQKTIAADGAVKQSFFPLATPGTDSQAAAVIDPAGYTRIRITRETSDNATPGPTVVSGPLKK